MAKLTTDIPRILEYIQTYGRLAGCTSTSLVSIDTVKRALNPSGRYYNAEFAAQVQAAFEEYRRANRHPSEDPECRRDALAQFKAGLKAGQSNSQHIRYDADGKPVEKLYKKPGISRWEFETVFPPRNFTEQAILTITANQLNDMATDLDLDETDRTKLMTWLSRWIQKAVADLQKMGTQPKYLDKE